VDLSRQRAALERGWERVVVVRALSGLGDMLCAVPALRALRAELPRAHIAVVAPDAVHPILERFDAYVDEVISFPGYPGLGGLACTVGALPAFLEKMHARRWDAVLQLHGSGIVSNPFAALLGGRETFGFYLPSQWCPDPDRFWPYPAHDSEVHRCLGLLARLGIPERGQHLEFPLRQSDRMELADVLGGERLDARGYAVVHPGAASPPRRWPAEHFARVVDALAGRGLRVVLTGTAQEEAVAVSVASAAHADTVNFAGRTSLGALAALVDGARVVVSNDTGVAHLADALATPSVVVFTWSDPARWAPLDRRRHRVVAQASVEQNPCRHGEVVTGHRCLRDGCAANARTESDLPDAFVPVDVVLAEADGVLAEADALQEHVSGAEDAVGAGAADAA
jgi:ADP-heptose:LPS heptosyltransferase